MAALFPQTCGLFYHFSVDDVFDPFIEVSDRQIPLFDHPFFHFLKEVHDECGTNISLYLFYQKRIHSFIRTLAEVSAVSKETLKKNPWLRFGPHALDYDTPPYAQSPAEQSKVFDAIYTEIERFAGNGGMSKWVRLHYFSESYELAEYFKTKDVTALLSTDKEAISYRMPAYAKEQLRNRGVTDYEGMTFVRSHLRVETLVRDRTSFEEAHGTIESLLTRLGHVVIMTHEYELAHPEVRAMTASILRYLKDHSVRSL
jgi:hypothetical protein